MYIFDSGRGRGQKCANALQTKNIDFIAGKCTFLQTEEDLDVAWERKILIFMQENYTFLTAQMVTDKNRSDCWFGASGRGYY